MATTLKLERHVIKFVNAKTTATDSKSFTHKGKTHTVHMFQEFQFSLGIKSYLIVLKMYLTSHALLGGRL